MSLKELRNLADVIAQALQLSPKLAVSKDIGRSAHVCIPLVLSNEKMKKNRST